MTSPPALNSPSRLLNGHVSHHHNPRRVIASAFKIDRLFLLLRYAVGFCPSLSLGTQHSAWYTASALQGHVSGEVKEPLEGCERPRRLTERSSQLFPCYHLSVPLATVVTHFDCLVLLTSCLPRKNGSRQRAISCRTGLGEYLVPGTLSLSELVETKTPDSQFTIFSVQHVVFRPLL